MSERPSIRDLWPDPPANLVQRLEHFMDQWRNVPDDYVILYTTIGVYDQPTGILMGDIRTLYGRERLGVDTVVYGSAADRLRDRLRKDVALNGQPPGVRDTDTPDRGQQP